MNNPQSQANRTRMIIWLLAGLFLYAAAVLTGENYPAVQTVFYKLGHVTTLAWVGYWISRQAMGRIDETSDPIKIQARAILMAGIIIAGSMGL